MDENPYRAPEAGETAATLSRRRWLGLRPSTWLVLVAILGWALATRPYWHLAWDEHGHPIEAKSVPYQEVLHWRGRTPIEQFLQQLNPRLKWPALALAVLIVWKAAWAIGLSVVRRSKAVAPE
jgi:hypothetical protein